LAKWLREPLVHFLALGALLFLLFALLGDAGGGREDRVVVSAAQVELLAQGFARTWQRPPSPEELDGLVEEYVREEIYYREALTMGLDRDDTIVRRRMQQKLEFFADDLVAGVDPSEEDLQAFLTENPETFSMAGRVTFQHVYFNRDERGQDAIEDARRLRERLAVGEEDADLESLGDRLPLPRRYREAPTDKVAGRFGSIFVEQLSDLPIGEWAGPVESGYGLHLVRIESREAGRVPELEEVRDAVDREWRAARRVEAKEAFYRGLRERYEVVIEGARSGLEWD
jgi:hypothetical protein